MNSLRSIDSFGQFFNFQIRREEKLNTAIGGFFTAFTLLLSFMISFLLGKDFYYRTNPQIIVTKISPQKIPTYKLSNDELTIAFRLEDDDGKVIESKNEVFIKTFFREYKVQDFFFNKTTDYQFKMQKCSQIPGQNFSEFPKFQPDSWFCLNFDELSDKLLGGNFNLNEDMSEIYIKIDSCNYDPSSNETNTPKEKLICSDADELEQYFERNNNKVFLNIMFPSITINTDELLEPVKVSGHTHFKKLDYLLVFDEYCNLDYYEFADDQGWISKSENKESFLTFRECSLNAKYRPRSSYTKEKLNTIFEMSITMNKVYPVTRRKFMKIQDVFAITGGFISFLKLIFGFLSSLFNKLERNKILVNYYFGDSDNNKSNNHNNFVNKKNKNYHEWNDKNNINSSSFGISFNNRNHNGKKTGKQISFLNKKTNLYIKEKNNLSPHPANLVFKNNDNVINNLEDKLTSIGDRKVNSVNDTQNINQRNSFNFKENEEMKVNNLSSDDEIQNKKESKLINTISERSFARDLEKSDLNNGNNDSWIGYKNLIQKNQNTKINEESMIFASPNEITKNDKENKLTRVDQIKDCKEKSFGEVIKTRKAIKQKNNFKNITFLSYSFNLPRFTEKNKLINLFKDLEYRILSKIDILHYLKNLKYIKIMKTILFDDVQRFYIENYYANQMHFTKANIKRHGIEEHLINCFDNYNYYLSERIKAFENNFNQKINNFIMKDIFKNNVKDK